MISFLVAGGLFIEETTTQSRVIFCDVGQGDAILITHGGTQMLVDTGRNASVLECLEEKMPFWDKKIELVVLTHPDADHIGGFPFVFESYVVSAIMYLPLEPDTLISSTVLEEISQIHATGGEVVLPFNGEIIHLDTKITGKVINPFFASRLESDCFESIAETQLWDKNSCWLDGNVIAKTTKNNLSIGIIMDIDGVGVFLSGDLEKEAELALLDSQTLQSVNVLKIGHHGAKTSTAKEFLEEISPEISVVSVGKNNTYGHPSPQVLRQIEDIGSRLFRTDTEGTVEFILKEGAILSGK